MYRIRAESTYMLSGGYLCFCLFNKIEEEPFSSIPLWFQINRSKVLALGKTQINLVFRSLIRTLATPKVLSLGKTQINLVFRSLIRTFVSPNGDSGNTEHFFIRLYDIYLYRIAPIL